MFHGINAKRFALFSVSPSLRRNPACESRIFPVRSWDGAGKISCSKQNVTEEKSEI